MWPFSEQLPEAVAQAVHDIVPGSIEHLRIFAEIRNTREAVTLVDAAGAPVLEIADDRVSAIDRVTGVCRAWREWEAEVIDESAHTPAQMRELIGAITESLMAAGATPSLSPSKIARAAGALLEGALSSQAEDRVIAALSIQDTADRIAGVSRSPERTGESDPWDPSGESAGLESANELARVDRLRSLAQEVLRGATVTHDGP